MPRLFQTCHVTVRDVCKTWCEREGARTQTPPHTAAHERHTHITLVRWTCVGHEPERAARQDTSTTVRYTGMSTETTPGARANARDREAEYYMKFITNVENSSGFCGRLWHTCSLYRALASRGSPCAFDGRAEVGELEHQVHQARVEPVEENLAVDWARRA